MSIFDLFRRQSQKESDADSSIYRDNAGHRVPPAGIWIRAKLGRDASAHAVIAFTYDDPQAGRSAKGGETQQGMQTEITIRFPGGCDSWQACTPLQVEEELQLPAKPEWIRAMAQVPAGREPSSGMLTTAFDHAVECYLNGVRTSRMQCRELNESGVALWKRQDLLGATTFFQKARSVAEQADDRLSLANAIGNEALVVLASDPANAYKLFTRQEGLWRELGPRLKSPLALALRNEIECLMKTGDTANANKKLKEVEELARHLKDKNLIEWVQGKMMFMGRGMADPGRPWRNDPGLKGLFSEEYPDDLIVDFREPGESRFEGMWVQAQGTARDGYYGVLLNEPKFLKSIRCGEVVVFRKEPEDERPRCIRKHN